MDKKDTEEEPTRRNRPLKWRFKNFIKNHWHGLALILLPLILLPIALVERSRAMRCLYMIVLMVSFWITNVIPYAVTAMFPIFLLPLLDIQDSEIIGKCYFSNITVLLALSIVIARSIEQSRLHKRIAVAVLGLIGFRPKALHLFLLSSTMFISLFVPNISTSAIMFPVIRAVLEELEKNEVLKLTLEPDGSEGEDGELPTNEALSFYLGIAYAANIGGVATLDGSGIALTFSHLYEEFFPTENLHWGWHFVLCFPLAVVLGVTVTTYLQFMFLGLWRNKDKYKTINKAATMEILRLEREPLGRITYHEVAVIIGFTTMTLLVFFRDPPGFLGYSDILFDKRFGFLLSK